tara:strand:- start:183 stop:509 length:327 start_codon:yes stop_codon:yes gene_type:complete
MTKLLQGRLPIELEPTVRGDTFNRAVRVLELSLDRVDPDKTPVFTSDERDELKFQAGSIIWNTTESVLQVYLGNSWQNISTPSTSGLSATGSVGTVQVVTNGNITVAL